MMVTGKAAVPFTGFFLAVLPLEGCPFLGDSNPGVDAEAANSGNPSTPSDCAGPTPMGATGALAFFFFEAAAEGTFLTI